MATGTETLAHELWRIARDDQQAARTVSPDVDVDAVRAGIRALAAAEGVRIRTALVGDTLIVARLDAAVWTDDAATMRAKLTPPD